MKDSLTLPTIRMAKVLSAFSLATDLGRMQPMGHVVRAAYIAMRIAHAMALSGEEQTVVNYATLLMHSGCTASSATLAALLQNDEVQVGRGRGWLSHRPAAVRMSREVTRKPI